VDERKIFIVEHRMEGLVDEVVTYESVIAFVGSTYEKAVDFIQKNGEEWLENRPDRREWWAIYTEIIDSDNLLNDVNLHFFDSNGIELSCQP